MHTSTVTVAVLEESSYKEIDLNRNEVNVIYTKDSGSGGQHKNKRLTCVVLTHLPTNIRVKNSNSRDQHKNKREAWSELTRRVNHYYRTGFIENSVEERRDQIGTGNRNEHIRTYNVKSDKVIDHRNGKSTSLRKYMRGNLVLLK